MRAGRASLLLLVPVLVAAGLQLRELGTKSLWIDEVLTVHVAEAPDLPTFFERHRASENQPPAHYLLLHGWIRLAGAGDAAVRVPSALFGVVSVAVLAWLGWLLAGIRAGILAALLLAVFPTLSCTGAWPGSTRWRCSSR